MIIPLSTVAINHCYKEPWVNAKKIVIKMSNTAQAFPMFEKPWRML